MRPSDTTRSDMHQPRRRHISGLKMKKKNGRAATRKIGGDGRVTTPF
jgi:hypothetical protein